MGVVGLERESRGVGFGGWVRGEMVGRGRGRTVPAWMKEDDESLPMSLPNMGPNRMEAEEGGGGGGMVAMVGRDPHGGMMGGSGGGGMMGGVGGGGGMGSDGLPPGWGEATAPDGRKVTK